MNIFKKIFHNVTNEGVAGALFLRGVSVTGSTVANWKNGDTYPQNIRTQTAIAAIWGGVASDYANPAKFADPHKRIKYALDAAIYFIDLFMPTLRAEGDWAAEDARLLRARLVDTGAIVDSLKNKL